MYEAEVNNSSESIETLPLEVRTRFAEFRSRVAARTTLPWGEHCTECVWPTCYTTCELYAPREDGACRQFAGGVVRIDHKEGLNPYVAKIRFKQWAKLWTVGNLELKPLSQADKKERFNIAVGAIGRSAPLPSFAKLRVLQKINYLRRVAAENAHGDGEAPDCFLLECFNPNERTIALTFTLRLRDRKEARPFQEMINVPPGYTRAKIAFSGIARSIDLSRAFEVEIVPNACDNTVLYFGLMDFVKELPVAAVEKVPATAGAKTFKCVVWDLDNTLWDGILIEDGPEKIRLREGVVDVIKETDQRGILHSIASKNNHDDALKVLREHGLEEYFLCPQIEWQPKSQSIARIAQLLNIGIDSLAFVDDQAFEREEVKTTLPQVEVIDAVEYAGIPERPECQVPVTAESKSRRLMYREQQQRETVLESYKGDYSGFLRACQMEADIQPLGEANLKRVYELAQRTNQLNFSGNRYQEAQLRETMISPSLETYVIHCKDRFGDYGIVGFAVVDTRVPRLLDLMFSCRVQAKRVEHAVLTFLLQRFVSESGKDFYANYRKTAKNAPSGKVFDEMGFELAAENEGVSSLIFRRTRDIPDDRIVRIVAQLGELANG
jgi:FkbH-like protein